MCVATRKANPAFSLVEMLASLAVLGMLVGLLLPAVQSAREAARRTGCLSNLKQVGLAVAAYEVSFGTLPPGRVGCDDTGETQDIAVCPPGLAADRKTAASGFVAILPQLEHEQLYAQLSVEIGGLWNRNVDDLGWYADPQKCRAVKQSIAVLICPSDQSHRLSDVYAPVYAATGSYAFSQGSLGPLAAPHVVKYQNNGPFLYVIRRSTRQLTDGTSNTITVGEVALADTWESSNTWTYALAHADCLRSTANPLNTQPGAGDTLERQNGAFGSEHPGGALFLFADGHARFVGDEIDPSTYRGMSTIAQAELAPE